MASFLAALGRHHHAPYQVRHRPSNFWSAAAARSNAWRWPSAPVDELRVFNREAAPVPFRDVTDGESNGVGLYLRTDFWVQISSGGSYGHTCYVAKELAATPNGSPA